MDAALANSLLCKEIETWLEIWGNTQLICTKTQLHFARSTVWPAIWRDKCSRLKTYYYKSHQYSYLFYFILFFFLVMVSLCHCLDGFVFFFLGGGWRGSKSVVLCHKAYHLLIKKNVANEVQFPYLRGTGRNANQNKPFFWWVTAVVNDLVICQICSSIKHLRRLRITCIWNIIITENNLMHNKRHKHPNSWRRFPGKR